MGQVFEYQNNYYYVKLSFNLLIFPLYFDFTNIFIFIETECLHDAEEADYELMETIIDNRLRRDSTNLQASFEDLAIRSIIEGFQIESEPESLELERQKHQKKDEIILNQEFQIEVETPVRKLIFRLKRPNRLILSN